MGVFFVFFAFPSCTLELIRYLSKIRNLSLIHIYKYEYYLSKRTSVYTGAGFAQVKYDDEGSDKTTQAYLGLTHRF